ncbi:MAG: lysozyme [Solirubrobacterales bacterium]|nr:lysozyme [Solirubrobacterales bacterium]
MRRFLPLIFLGIALLWAPAQSQAVTMFTTKFVADFEGFVSCPYADPAGHATIGYGHLLHYGPPTRADRRRWGCISEERALKILQRDLLESEQEVFERIGNAPVTHPMITALTSFAFNLGGGYLDFVARRGNRPATNIGRAIRVGKYRRAARQMLYFDGVIVGGKRYELEGLQIRRRKEYRLMLRGIRQLRSCDGPCSTGSGGGLGT